MVRFESSNYNKSYLTGPDIIITDENVAVSTE